MKKSEKKVEALLAKDENILWTGQAPGKYAVLTVLNPGNLLFDGMICLFLWLSALAHSVVGITFCVLIALIMLIYIMNQITAALGKKYYVTNKGIYEHNPRNMNTPTVFMSYDDLESVCCEHLHDIFLNKLGILTCMDHIGRFIRIANIQMPEYVEGIINDQKERYELELETGIPAALQDADYPIRMDIPADTIPETEPAAQPEQTFFAAPAQQEYAALRNDFLDQTVIGGAEQLENLPDTSVAALQHELFGNEAPQTQAIPDPTVHPLPELPAETDHTDDSPQVLQQGL